PVSFYESGATEVGRLFSVLTPSAIKQEIDSVDHYVRRIDADIQAHKSKLADLLNDWHLFVEEWTTFRDGAGWFARTTGATYDKALDYRKRADAWDELIRRRGASTAPVGTTPARALRALSSGRSGRSPGSASPPTPACASSRPSR